MTESPNGLLSIALSAAVPLWIMKFVRAGGPSDADYEAAVAFALTLAEKGDVLLFGRGGRRVPPGEPSVADLFNGLARSVAVLAFCPGGITVFGQHYEVPRDAP